MGAELRQLWIADRAIDAEYLHNVLRHCPKLEHFEPPGRVGEFFSTFSEQNFKLLV